MAAGPGGLCDVALQDVVQTAAEPFSMHRNAPTALMKSIGCGQGYEYAHELENKVADMQCLPDNLRDRKHYHPTNEGVERRIRAIGGDQEDEVEVAAGLRMSAARSASRHSRV